MNDEENYNYYYSIIWFLSFRRIIKANTNLLDVDSDTAEEIKNAFANSMMKWNNVVYYSYDSTGNIQSHNIINIVEGSAIITGEYILNPRGTLIIYLTINA